MQRRGSVNAGGASSRIRVAVRVRPPDCKIPKDETRAPCVAPSPNPNTPNVLEFRHDTHSKTFTFDNVCGTTASQEDVYASALQPLMAQFLDGYNVTVMAYGQTGSGKTYTMGSKATVFNTTPTTSPCRERASSIPPPTIATPETRNYQGSAEDGLIPRFLHDLFVNLKREPSMKEIRVTFVEIYLDTIRDLLDDRSDKSLSIREDSHNVWVENVRSIQVETLAKALEVLNAGRARQTVGMNALNDESSRSHAVYTMEVSRKFSSEIKKSKLTFVDLAGSERIKKTDVDGTRRRESININMGLSALGNVINALVDQMKLQRRCSQESSPSRPSSPDTHIPYRASKLTRLLRDGLGGNARTLIIACVSPLGSNADETMNTLQFANRARNIQNKAEKNVNHDLLVVTPNPSELEIARLHEDIKRLQQQVIELEAASQKREQDIAAVEQARLLRKERRRDSLRDAEMTTEIAIMPVVDAHTQHEGESTEEKRLSVVDVDTMTECVEDGPASTSADTATQIGIASAELIEKAIMTDLSTQLLTTETCSDCDLVASPSVDCGSQVGISFMDLNDSETSTDPEPQLVTFDASTECFTTSYTDSECQYDFPTKLTDAETFTESEPPIKTTDSCTECAVFSLHDADCQVDLCRLHTMDAATDAIPDTHPSVVETACQYDLTSLTDVGTSTDAVVTLKVVEVGTECIETPLSTIGCQSDVDSVDVGTVTDPQPATETADASIDCVVVGTVDEGSQSEMSASLMVEFGTTTDPVPGVLTSNVSTDCPIADIAHTASQCDIPRSIDVGVITEAADTNRTADVLDASVPCAVVQSGLIPSQTEDESAVCGDVAEVMSLDALPDVADEMPRDCFSAVELSADTETTDVPQLVCPSPTSSVSTLSDTGDNALPVVPLALCGDGFAKTQELRLGEEMVEWSDEFTAVSKSDYCPSRALPKSLDPAAFSSLSDLHSSQEICGVSEVVLRGTNVLDALVEGKSTKVTRSLTPEVEEEEFAEAAGGHSENQRDIGASDPSLFVCGSQHIDDLLTDLSVTTRGTPDDEPVSFESYRTECEHEDHTSNTDHEQSCDFVTSTTSLVVKPPVIETNLPCDLDVIDPSLSAIQGEMSLAPPQPPIADFVRVRSPRRGIRTAKSQQISPRGATSRRNVSPSSHQAVRPLRIFTFDDRAAVPTPEKTAAQAKNLYENLRQLVRDEFGNDFAAIDPDGLMDTTASPNLSTVDQLMTETKEFIKRRQKRHQRIAHLRRHILALEDVLEVENRAPISEPKLKAYSERVQEEFLCKLSQQLLKLAAERLHSRLTSRIEAEKLMPLPSDDDNDTTSPFLNLNQCQACAEWFFHRVDDATFFEKQILPLVTSGWIALTSRHLEAEQAWFQL